MIFAVIILPIFGFMLSALLTVGKIADIKTELFECKTELLRYKRGAKQGVWRIDCDGYYPYCNQCGYEPPYVSGKDMRTLYCPICGAEMKKEGEDE